MAEERDVEVLSTSEPSFKIDYEHDVVPVLIDSAHVAHSPEMFAVMLAERSPFVRASEGGLAIPRASLRLTPQAFVSLVAAMASNWNKWAEANTMEGSPRFSITNAEPLDLQPSAEKDPSP